jgi:DNA-binding winged helix-turn-helix (wHTH) protein/Tol biopolymer transport system component
MYDFGPFRLDPAKRLLVRTGAEIALAPKAMDALIYLIEHRDRVVRKDELIEVLWPDVAVQDSSLTQLIFLLRKALACQGDQPEYISTVSRHGYRFIEPVRAIEPAPADREPVTRHLTQWKLAGLAIAAAAVAAPFLLDLRRPPSDVHAIRTFIRPPANTLPSLLGDVESPPMISHDGRQIAFVARALDGRAFLWIRPLDTLEARALPGTEDAIPESPFWSPDGGSLAFVADARLKRVDVGAGSVQVLANNVSHTGVAWGVEGMILFSRKRGLFRVQASGGGESPVLAPKGPDEMYWDPVFLPDGRHFFFTVMPMTRGTPEVRLGSLDSRDSQPVLSGPDLSQARYASPFMLFLREGRALAQRFDPVALKLAGEPISIGEDVSYTDHFAAISASDNGVLAYRTGHATPTELTWQDRTGRVVGHLGSPPGHILSHSLSPDGASVVASIRSGSAADDQIWILDVAGGPPRRIPHPPGFVSRPVWSPDSASIAFLIDDDEHERTALVRQDVRSARAPERLLESPHLLGVFDWFHDGRSLLIAQEDEKFRTTIWSLPVAGDRRDPRPVRTGSSYHTTQISPDSRWLAYQAKTDGRNAVYVTRFSVDGPSWQVSDANASSPRWSRDGTELYYLENDRRLMAVPIMPSDVPFHTGAAVHLFDVHVGNCGCFNFVPSTDGQQFLVNAFPTAGESQPLVIVQNWTAQLDALRR